MRLHTQKMCEKKTSFPHVPAPLHPCRYMFSTLMFCILTQHCQKYFCWSSVADHWIPINFRVVCPALLSCHVNTLLTNSRLQCNGLFTGKPHNVCSQRCSSRKVRLWWAQRSLRRRRTEARHRLDGDVELHSLPETQSCRTFLKQLLPWWCWHECRRYK